MFQHAILQIKHLKLLIGVSDLENEFLPRFRLEMKVLVAFAWQGSRRGAQAVPLMRKLASFSVGYLRRLMFDLQDFSPPGKCSANCSERMYRRFWLYHSSQEKALAP